MPIKLFKFAEIWCLVEKKNIIFRIIENIILIPLQKHFRVNAGNLLPSNQKNGYNKGETDEKEKTQKFPKAALKP